MNTRFFYDDDRTIKRLEESTFLGRYQLDAPGNGAENGTKPYYMMDPQIIPQKWSGNLYTNSVDLESRLFNVGNSTKNSRYSGLNFKPFPNSSPIEYPTTTALTTEQSRAILPAQLFRELPQCRYDYLFFDPQLNVSKNFQNNLDTRILEKDYYAGSVNCLNL